MFRLLEWGLMLVLTMPVLSVPAQESQTKQVKRNPSNRPLEIGTLQQNISDSIRNIRQRPLPKFDLPEYIITGIASVDLPKLEKISFDDTRMQRTTTMPFGKSQRERETIELEGKNRIENLHIDQENYTGLLQGGIGSYFTPQVGLWFGQTLPAFNYLFDGTYYLTKGYMQNTDQSRGSFRATGGTSLVSNISILRNAALNGMLGYQSESFHFYGSSIPNLQRTVSDFRLHAGIENQTVKDFPYVMGISVRSLNIADSSASTNETLFDLNLLTTLPVASLPIHMKLYWMSATGGLGLMDLSGGIQDYWYAGMLFEGSLHLYWAKGMAGQNLVRLRPHLMASYQITSKHRAYVSYEPMLIPMTMASSIQVNRFLSSASTVRHADVTNGGELGVESDWNRAIRSRVSFSVKSIEDLAMFSDLSRPGIWTLEYGGQKTIVTFCAEMFAKLESNDYFASNIKLRSTKDSFWGNRIPYIPAIEAGCYASHRFGAAIVASANVRFVGERKADLAGSATVSRYVVVDVSGEYTPLDFLKLLIEIKNLTDARYEIWRGYREFPLTIHVALQVKW